MTQVAILWHMHQPFYEDLVTREHIMPWVRLHALKDYFGMVALLREFPSVKVTFNLVPSLLVQLDAFARDRARDRFLDLSLKPSAELTDADRAFIVANFFHAQRSRMIDAYPRYAELLALRGTLGMADTSGADPGAATRRFGPDDLRDLQVWHKLAWIDPEYMARDERVRRLIGQGRGFTEDDKLTLRAVELEILNAIVPAYRDLADRDQIELSTSPFYHPILPLLCDTDIYRRTHPDARLPRGHFVHPEDAAEQLARSVAYHEQLFGRRPQGLWPSEGSVSDAVVPIVAQAGFTWMATDELILARSLGTTFTRDETGALHHPEQLYVPYDVGTPGARVACAFRDQVLSDRIGFVYATWSAEDAADDLVQRFVEGGRRYAAKTGGGEAVLSIILDGENAWEHYEGGGRPFLRALYGRLSDHPELRSVTMGEACGSARRTLPGIFPGSWIDANFSIWIGHADDQRAWGQLAEARRVLDATPGTDLRAARLAREEVLIAEGSDWFWWYGDDHSSPHDPEFDDLFRRHLRNVYKLLQQPVPDELFVSNISTGAPPPLVEPTGFVTPAVDGEETSYFEWLAAGVYEVRDTAGAMHRTDRPPSLVTLVRFGFDRARLYVRIDARRALADLLADGLEWSLKFLRPALLRYSVDQRTGTPEGRFWTRTPQSLQWTDRDRRGAAIAAGTVLEIAIPFADLGVQTGDSVAFFVAVYDAAGTEIERHPGERPIEVRIPDATFEARHWRV